jgi:hypothetical protein
MRCFWLVTAVLAITFGTAGQVHADFVVNGSFEAVQIGTPFYSQNPTDIPGWTHTGTTGDALLWAVGYPNVTVAGDGRQFVTLGGGIFESGTASWQQTLTGLSPGGTYILTFEMASEQAVSAFQSITVDFPSGSPTGAMTFTAGTTSVNDWQDWEQKTLDFVANSSAVTLRFSATTQYDVGLDNVRVEAKTVPFAAFAAKLELTLGPSVSLDVFDLNRTFSLGAGSNRIAPLIEAVSLALAGGTSSVTLTIPAGSFTRTGNGGFAFEGTINGVALEAQIRPRGNQCTFKAEGTGANLTGIANPVTVTLTIGDDSGTTTVTAEIQ